jgi:hypothetical protein
MSQLPSEGLQAILPLRRDIELDDEASDASKYVKLRFTRKQYDAFRNACNIFSVASEHPEFNSFVQRALSTSIRASTIKTQLVHPIVDAPTKTVHARLKIHKADIEGEEHVPKITHFTKPIPVTDVCLKLHLQVAALVDNETKYNIGSQNLTCITDIRRMLSKYINVNNLKTDEGTLVDVFLQTIAQKSIHDGANVFIRTDGNYIIPKGNRKIQEKIVNEIAFGF